MDKNKKIKPTMATKRFVDCFVEKSQCKWLIEVAGFRLYNLKPVKTRLFIELIKPMFYDCTEEILFNINIIIL